MSVAASVVFVVDDDPSVRRSIKRLVESVGLQVELFGSALEFLHSERPDLPSCLVLDIRLPGMSGLDFQRELAPCANSLSTRRSPMPVRELCFRPMIRLLGESFAGSRSRFLTIKIS
jgi:CheY-like chemotaxis protein